MQRVQAHSSTIAPRRWLHSAVLYKHFIFIFGGFGSYIRTNDLYKFDLITKRWELIPQNGKTIPSPRAGHTAEVYKNSMYIVGGLCDPITPFLADTYKYDFEKNEWYNVSYNGKLPQVHTHAMTRYKDFLYVFGGFMIADQTHSNGLFKYDIIRNHWNKVNYNGTIPPLCGCSMICCGDLLFVFGGSNHGEHSSSLYQYNCLRNEWKCISMDGDFPNNRVGHSATLYGPYMIILGGHTGNKGCCNTMYKWSIINHKWSLVDCNNYSKRICHISIIDEDRLLIHGGSCPKTSASSSDDGYFNDVLIYEFGNGLKSCLWKTLNSDCATIDVIFL